MLMAPSAWVRLAMVYVRIFSTSFPNRPGNTTLHPSSYGRVLKASKADVEDDSHKLQQLTVCARSHGQFKDIFGYDPDTSIIFTISQQK